MFGFFVNSPILRLMKRLLLLLFCIPFFTLAQVPQGVGYQGVAIDANGVKSSKSKYQRKKIKTKEVKDE